ncbi:hypothetical protein [Streptococcus ruminantium]|uniref:hypothetical protein n=1 Tax=Streptococcus ruminantium TaxID=1917441 RepID=UPI0012DD40E6|nr:hypothetical protein [Streptococcus ruminantium]
MKKYLIVVSLLTALLSIGYYFYYFDGSLYLPQMYSDSQIQYTFQIQNQKLIQKTKQGNSPFIVKGVNMGSGIAGYHENDFAIGKERYLSWMQKISEMGANTIRVKSIMDVAFYEALDEHNNRSKYPLYLLQGVRIDDYRDNSAIDAFHEYYRGQLLHDVKDAVDIIHGRRKVWNTNLGSQYYKKDVSKWVLGFAVGDQWNSSTIAYTNHQVKKEAYEGKYVRTIKEVTPFEVMLAQVMDEMVAYESKKYGWQHLITFGSSALTDPFIYQKPFAAQTSKYAQLDIEHIVPTSRLKTGLFASYQLLDYHPKALDYVIADRSNLSQEVIEVAKQKNYPENYTHLLKSHHRVPVLISSYGYSTSRGITALSQEGIEGPLSEKQQGELLVRDYQSFLKAGTVGALVETWQDDWGARTWNTSFTTNRHSRFQWGDVQSNNQGFGLLAFENQVKNHVIDGKLTEWNIQPLIEHDGAKLSVDSDENYLYFAIKKEGLTPQDKWTLPLDITPKTGSLYWEHGKLNFQSKVDFILSIDGTNGSHLLVQNRYDAVRANYLKQIKGIDPFVDIPESDSSHFHPVSLLLKHNRIFDDLEKAARQDKWNPVFETGKLRVGNSQRGAEDFDSRSDIYFGKDVVEVRIPWQLLNFSNPAQGKIHDDYYMHYGVSEMRIDQIGIGIGQLRQNNNIPIAFYRINKWNKPNVTGVLKESYTILKNYWKENKDGS